MRKVLISDLLLMGLTNDNTVSWHGVGDDIVHNGVFGGERIR